MELVPHEPHRYVNNFKIQAVLNSVVKFRYHLTETTVSLLQIEDCSFRYENQEKHVNTLNEKFSFTNLTAHATYTYSLRFWS